jgi:hypothetical protein
MKIPHIALVVALLATSGAAIAQDAPNNARCLLLANAFANQAKDANQQKLAEASIYFYLGRIGGQPTTAQLKATLDAQAKTLNDSNAGPLMNDCVKAVQAKIELMQSLSAQQPQQAKPKPPANPQGR